MSSTDEPSLEELRARAELSRAALAANVTELRGRVNRVTSPSNIKDEVRTYVRNEREGFVDNLRAKAAENPLQAAAVAAAVAYPALSIVRAIPVPLMLIGAGLFLTTKRGQDAAAPVRAKVDDAARRGAETVSEMTETVRSRVGEKVSALRGQAQAATDAVASRASAMSDTNTLREGTHAAKARLAEMASSTVEDVSERASRARGSVTRFASENALLLAGIGAVAGALLASSFPMSAAENRVLGPGKRKVKDAVRTTAVRGMEKAGDVVADAFENVTSAAAREGLDSSGLQQTVGDLTEKARAVADRSLDAALGQDRQDQHQNQHTFSERNPT